MATRIVQQAIFGSGTLGPGQSGVPRCYFLMTDGTMWLLTNGTWAQAPALPGSRVVSCIEILPGDTAFAAATDGTIWSAQVTAPFTWTQVAVTPP
jgi:hypothetical protein